MYDLQDSGGLFGDEGGAGLRRADQHRKLNGVNFAGVGCKPCRHVRFTQWQFVGNAGTGERAECFRKPHRRGVEDAEMVLGIDIGNPPF